MEHVVIDDLTENPEQYRAALIRAGILSEPQAAPEAEVVRARSELKDTRPAVRDRNGRVCRRNPDGTLERVHFHQQLVTSWVDSKTSSYPDGAACKVLNVKSFIHLPGEDWTDCKGYNYTLTERGEVICTDIRLKGKGNRKLEIKERRLARGALAKLDGMENR